MKEFTKNINGETVPTNFKFENGVWSAYQTYPMCTSPLFIGKVSGLNEQSTEDEIIRKFNG